jgi:GT2 family glycosyltransferase/GR25 family glycosyltransferase involved in LPS biosynthesis
MTKNISLEDLDKHIILLERNKDRYNTLVNLQNLFPDLKIIPATDGKFINFVQDHSNNFYILVENMMFPHNPKLRYLKMGYNEAGCAISHLRSLIRFCNTSSKNYLLQLEDDVVCLDKEKFLKQLENLPETEFDICQLYTTTNFQNKNKINDYFYEVGNRGFNMACSLIISKNGAKKILTYLNNTINIPADDVLSVMNTQELLKVIFTTEQTWITGKHSSSIWETQDYRTVVWDKPITKRDLMFLNIGNWTGIGNQMFQYASMKVLELKLGKKLVVKKDHKYKLDNFQYIRDNQEICEKFPEVLTIKEQHLNFDENLYNLPKGDIILDGYFQDSKYFEEYKPLIKLIFKFEKTIEDLCNSWRNNINKKVIGIHLRVPDIYHEPINKFLYTVPTANYLKSALTTFDNSCKFVIFSNNVKWSKELFHDVLKDYDIEYQENSNEIIDLCKLSLCDGYILSPSSFSWWAIFLNKNTVPVVQCFPWFSITGNGSDLNNQTEQFYKDEYKVYDINADKWIFNKKPDNAPLISVIIPSYNRYQYVKRAINSVLEQTYKNLEIIVIDDCSTEDEYKNLSEDYKNNSEVKIIRLEKNMRLVHNSKHAQGMTRNEGIKIAKGEWICFLDDDDFYSSPHKLERQISQSYQYQDIKLFCTNMYSGYGLDKNNYAKQFLLENFGTRLTTTDYLIDEELLLKTNYVCNSTVMLHRSIIDKVGLLEVKINEDYEYWKRCIKHTKILYYNIPCVGYDIMHANGQNYS